MKRRTFDVRFSRAGLALGLVAALGLAMTSNATDRLSLQNIALSAAAPAHTYQVEDLGTLPGDFASAAMGINASGDVVGWSLGPNGSRAFLYSDAAGMKALPSPAGRLVTTARAVNDTGTVVGTAALALGSADIGHAVLWQSGTVRDLGTLGTGLFSEGHAVNAAGVVVGSSYTGGGGLLGIHAFRYDGASGLVDLTPAADTARAEGINDAGQVTGYRESRAFRLTGTTFTDLGVAPGFGASFGSAINSSGQVAGHVITSTGNSEKIFRYTDGAGMVILGGLGQLNRAYGINTTGDVVGSGQPTLGPRQGFLYTDANGMQGLNTLIDPAAGWFVLGAGGINDAGQIAGWASGPVAQHAVRLTPTGVIVGPVAPSAPSSLAAAVLARTRVRLNWTDSSSNELGFRIERAVGSQTSFVLLAQVSANATTYTDRTVKARNAYRYRVRAFNAAGPSAWSITVTVPAR